MLAIRLLNIGIINWYLIRWSKFYHLHKCFSICFKYLMNSIFTFLYSLHDQWTYSLPFLYPYMTFHNTKSIIFSILMEYTWYYYYLVYERFYYLLHLLYWLNFYLIKLLREIFSSINLLSDSSIRSSMLIIMGFILDMLTWFIY